VGTISFEVAATPTARNPDRMDVACFLGFVAERRDPVVPSSLRRWLLTQRLSTEARLAVPGERLRDVPLPLQSPDEMLEFFDADARLDGPAELASTTLPFTLPTDAVPELHVVIDGTRHTIALDPPPATPAELVAAIAAAGAPVTARLGGEPGAPSLVLLRRRSSSAGRLTVFANAAYGFPVAAMAESRVIGTPLCQAVRTFFAQGGRRAWAVRMGDPLAYLAPRDDRFGQLATLLARGGGGGAFGARAVTAALGAELPSPHAPTEARSGLGHLFGLDDATFVLMPDLPELAAPPPASIPLAPAPPAPREVFATCGAPPAATLPHAAAGLPPPRLDAMGAAIWTQAVERVLDVLRLPTLRDRILIAAQPRCEPGLIPSVPASAFLQIAAPWARTPEAASLPGTLIAPDGVLAGLLASHTLQLGTFRSAAGRGVPSVEDLETSTPPPVAAFLTRAPRGIELASDTTTSADPSWRIAAVSRLMALLVRAARRLGHSALFEPSGEMLWRDLEMQIGILLTSIHAAGGLAGRAASEGFSVRCDRSTMTQADIDNGRLIAAVSFSPALPIERIAITLPLGHAAILPGAPA
jgi:hypothetical protein